MKVSPLMIQGEFVGLKTRIVKSSNPSCIGINGRVIDETQKTFTILQKKHKKTIVKRGTVFHFTLADTIVEVDGMLLEGRPEERLKKRLRRRW